MTGNEVVSIHVHLTNDAVQVQLKGECLGMWLCISKSILHTDLLENTCFNKESNKGENIFVLVVSAGIIHLDIQDRWQLLL